MPWPLPVKVWLLIIDELGAQGEYDALEACADAGGGLLKERAKRYIPKEMTFRTPEEVASINVGQRWKGPEEVHIVGGRRGGERLPIPHLATFASRLAGKWTNVNELTIERAEWRVQDLDRASLLLDLGYFNNVRELCHLGDVEVVQNVIDTQTLSAFGLQRRATRLVEIHVQRRTGSLTAHSRHIHVDMPFSLRLNTLEFGDDFSLLSDLQSLHDLVDFFIQTGTTARLISLIAPLGPDTPQPQHRLKLHRF
ncbi:predicted protein [Postia placenta Mad-698-R]|nr:predicted protein [Postia placenta Mad-698-R]